MPTDGAALRSSLSQVGPNHRRIVQQVSTRAFQHDPAPLEHVAAVRDPEGELRHLFDQEERDALVPEAGEDVVLPGLVKFQPAHRTRGLAGTQRSDGSLS